MSARLVWSVFGLTLALLLAALVLAGLNGFATYDWGTEANVFFLSVPVVAFSLVGALIASRHQGNAIGWISLAVGFGLVLTFAAPGYAEYAIETEPGALPGAALMASLDNWVFVPFVGMLGIFLVLLFPHGRLESRRQRVIAWLGGAGIVLASVSGALFPGPIDSYPSVRNPLGLEGAKAPIEAAESLGFLLLLIGFAGAGTSMVRRFRRARGVERQQLKWFAFAAAAMAAVFVPVCFLRVFVSGDQPLGVLLSQDLVSVAFAGPAVATGIAVLRYRLYDIDVVINRTLVYGALTATLAVVYLGSVLLLQLALSGVTEGSELAVAASTLAVAALFRPARAWIQERVDRRFFRRKYDAARTLEAFSSRLRDEVDLGTLNAELGQVVRETLQPAHVSLWLRTPEAER